LQIASNCTPGPAETFAETIGSALRGRWKFRSPALVLLLVLDELLMESVIK